MDVRERYVLDEKLCIHEVLDDTVELGALVAVVDSGPVLLDTSCQRPEVLSRLGHSAAVQTDGD